MVAIITRKLTDDLASLVKQVDEVSRFFTVVLLDDQDREFRILREPGNLAASPHHDCGRGCRARAPGDRTSRSGAAHYLHDEPGLIRQNHRGCGTATGELIEFAR